MRLAGVPLNGGDGGQRPAVLVVTFAGKGSVLRLQLSSQQKYAWMSLFYLASGSSHMLARTPCATTRLVWRRPRLQVL